MNVHFSKSERLKNDSKIVGTFDGLLLYFWSRLKNEKKQSSKKLRYIQFKYQKNTQSGSNYVTYNLNTKK